MSPEKKVSKKSPSGEKKATTSIVVNCRPKNICEYFYSTRFRNAVAERVFNNRRITIKDIGEVYDELQVIFDMIDYVNSLPENTFVILNRNLDDFVIPEEFKSFIRPNSVRYDSGDRRCPNLLPLLEFTKKEIPNYNDYLDAISRYRSFYKKGSSDNLVYLSSLRIDRSFEEVRPQMMVCQDDTGMVHYDGTPFIPIMLNYGEGMFLNHYYETSDHVVLKDWILLLNNN